MELNLRGNSDSLSPTDTLSLGILGTDKLVNRTGQMSAIRDAELAIQRVYKKLVSLPDLPEDIMRELCARMLDSLVTLNAQCASLSRQPIPTTADVEIKHFSSVLPLPPDLADAELKGGILDNVEADKEESEEPDSEREGEEPAEDSDPDESEQFDEF